MKVGQFLINKGMLYPVLPTLLHFGAKTGTFHSWHHWFFGTYSEDTAPEGVNLLALTFVLQKLT